MIDKEMVDYMLRYEVPRLFGWGIMIEGDQEVMCKGIEMAMQADVLSPTPFTYVEIGVAEGGTFRAISDFLELHIKDLPSMWRSIGIDIPAGWSLNVDTIRAKFYQSGLFHGTQLDPTTFAQHIESHPTGASVYLMRSQDFLNLFRYDIKKVNFAFIDGCHGYPCVKEDFEVLEPLIPVGGMVCFHDSDDIAQGVHMQPHCGQPIGVRKAIEDLKLFGNKREGWKMMCDISGNPGNYGCCIVKKVS